MSTEYQPESRRPIADPLRNTVGGAVRLCVRLGVHPDAISYASIVAAALAGACFWQAGKYPWLLIVGPLFCQLRLYCNMLDGMVALAAKRASRRGEILNDFPDRISDVLIFAGVAHSGLAMMPLGYWAAIMALLTAYVGTLGAAVGARREFGGVMSKPWRMQTLHVGAWVAFALMHLSHPLPQRGELTILDWTCIVIIVGCVQTVIVRLKKIFATLDAKKAAQAPAVPSHKP